MSALGHYIEANGIPTTGISLVREHTEAMRAPRFLWVPFELGRPFGAPGDPAFQTRVLRHALGLLERADGPVILEDFPEDAPALEGGSGEDGDGSDWVCPVRFGPPPEALTGFAAAVVAEIDSLAPWYDLAVNRRGGRTTVGNSGLDIHDCAKFAAAFLDGEAPANPRPELAPAETLKQSIEDLKAYYQEAGIARPGAVLPQAASARVADWLWGETALGALMLKLQPRLAASADPKLAFLGKGFVVPREQKHRLG